MNPCCNCGISLEIGARLVALVHGIFMIIGDVACVVALFIFALKYADDYYVHHFTLNTPYSHLHYRNTLVILVTCGMIIFSGWATLDYNLWYGAKKRSEAAAKMWVQVNWVHVAISVLVVVPLTFFVFLPQLELRAGWFLAALAVALIFNLYAIFVVTSFLKEVRKEEERGRKEEHRFSTLI